MAIAYDTASNGGPFTTSTSSWSHTCTGSNGLISIWLEINTTAANPVSGVTYGGQSCTKDASACVTDATNGISIQHYYLLNPPTGANNVVVTWTTGGGKTLVGGAISLTGVSAHDAANTASGAVGAGNSNQPSVNVTTVADNCWVLGATGVNDNSALAAGSSQSKRFETDESGSPFHTVAGNSRGPKTPAGSATISFTGAVNSDNWVIGGASFSPAVAATSALEWMQPISQPTAHFREAQLPI